MKRQYAVIGMGRFGSSVAATLYKEGNEVLAIDKNSETINDHKDTVSYAVIGDSTEIETMKEVGIRNFDTVIVAIGDDIQASILTVLLLKELDVKHVIAKALSKNHGQVLAKIGADKVIFPEKDMGERVAHHLMAAPNVLNFIELSEQYSIEEIHVPRSMTGKNLRELDLRARFNVTVVAIKEKSKINISPDPEENLESDDILLVIGENKDLENFTNLI
ncbi:TrkA family potassium uptake protein [Mesobacillus maritimus]|uniref:potassium channel family protein n=1 Tax=Mesobacillus maritimus TaxID=1643336 RepID=UPI00203AB482|nr:TrkA family potassium uptake protein [Mesobacillus maritimus]MCM3588434.1 TrkA family potassium uptake protein [Mesobacillus maritimus]MCM3670205.1 TrkA family potassium uptake protein [Mesobacillus maritimus]